MKKVVIAGGTGFIGSSLAFHLHKHGFQPVILARNRPKNSTFEFQSWDAVNQGEWTKCLEDSFAIVNLVGKSVNCIKTPDNCDVILRSRVDATKALGLAMKNAKNPPEIWIQMSTAHIYGDPPSQVCTELSTEGYGLAPFVAKAWEKAFLESLPAGCREVRLRTSFVIGKQGGALASLKQIVKLGLGGKVGSGDQGMSWIHEFDVHEFILQAILNPHYSGIFVLSSPNPVSNRMFMKELRKVYKMPIGLNSPAFLTKIGAKLLFNTDPELALYGRYVKSERMDEVGFKFNFPLLTNALQDLVS
jgi:uncharacterized protein